MVLALSGTHKLAGVGSLAKAVMIINFTVSGCDFIGRSYKYSSKVRNYSVGGTKVSIYYRISTLFPIPLKLSKIAHSEMHSHVLRNL